MTIPWIRWRGYAAATVLAGAIALPLSIAAQDARVPPQAPASAAQLGRGKAVFDEWCAGCHAPGPRHPGTQALDALYKGKKPGALEERTDLVPKLTETFVRKGVSVMPPFRKTEIDDTDLAALSAYLSRQDRADATGTAHRCVTCIPHIHSTHVSRRRRGRWRGDVSLGRHVPIVVRTFPPRTVPGMGPSGTPAPHTPAPAAWNDNAVTLAWLGHATVLINFFGVRILTDPTLFARIGVDVGVGSLGPLRLVQSALPPAGLPEIDLVLVSHAHFDHLDTPSLGALRGRPHAVMAAKTSDLLPRSRYASVTELEWNQMTRVVTSRGDVQIRALEVRHWGARLGRDTYRGYVGFVVEREGRKLLIGGDTAHTALFADHRRFGPFDAAVMPIGAYDPWIRNHCTPEQAVAMADAAGARLIVPVHHQTFQLSREPHGEPIERALAALAREPARLALREIGETVVLLK